MLFIRDNLVRPWLVVLVVCLVYLGAILVRHGGDPMAFATVGSRFWESDPEGTPGYDGQFAYAIALDPIGAAARMDVPAYRYQRILYPMVARLLALGRPDWLPWSLVLVNLLSLVAGTAIVEPLLVQNSASRWYALVYGLYAGLLMPVRLDLNEPLSYGLVMAGIWAWEARRMCWSAVAFGLAVLAKETALLFPFAFGLYLLLTAGWRPATRFGLISAGPYFVWQVALWLWLGSPGLGSGGEMATPFELVPLMGLWQIGVVSPATLLLYLGVLGPLVLLPTVWALWNTVWEVSRRRWHPITLSLLANAAVMLFLPHSSWREFLAMLRLSVGLVATVLLFAALRRNRRALTFSWGWLASLAFLFKEGPV